MRVSKLAVGVTAAVGVLSLGVAAFALDGDTDTGTVTEPSVTTAPPAVTEPPGTTTDPLTDPATEDPTAAPTDPTDASDPTTGVSTDGCPEGQTFANHGEYVRSVAHDPDRAPGDQAAAAQSDCGKPSSATTGDADTTDPEDPADPVDPIDSTAPAPAAPRGPAGSPGNRGNAPGHNK